MTLLDPAQSIANLIYVGHNCNAASALHITRRRSVDRKKQQTERNVFQCFVFGPKKAGKSALLMSLLGRCRSWTIYNNFIRVKSSKKLSLSKSIGGISLVLFYNYMNQILLPLLISIMNENFVVSPNYRPFSENYVPTTSEKYVVNVVDQHVVSINCKVNLT